MSDIVLFGGILLSVAVLLIVDHLIRRGRAK